MQKFIKKTVDNEFFKKFNRCGDKDGASLRPTCTTVVSDSKK